MRYLAGILFFCQTAVALAHDPGLSSANLRIGPHEISAVVTYNDRDILATLVENPAALGQDTAATNPKLLALARHVLSLEANGRPCPLRSVAVAADKNKNIEFTCTYTRPPGSTEITVRSELLPSMPFGHRQAFSAIDMTGREIARSLLSNQTNTARVIPGETAPAVSHPFFDFLFLGIRHILTGYDHLLFLFGLLIVCRNWREAALLVTCFTLAHSLTLALSTFGLIELRSRWVESAIAASILYVGVENLLRGASHFRGRWLLTFTFGLVHGLGFASVLREMGIANSGVAAIVPLVAFNSGVEIGQLSVAALLLPLILHFRRNPRFLRMGVPACSALVALAGGCWLVQRAFFG